MPMPMEPKKDPIEQLGTNVLASQFNTLISLIVVAAVVAFALSLAGCAALKDASRCQPGRIVPINPSLPTAGYYFFPGSCQ